ncbi:MAG: hypothetical protein V1734_06865 [Nanoarchaeota archaeon]
MKTKTEKLIASKTRFSKDTTVKGLDIALKSLEFMKPYDGCIVLEAEDKGEGFEWTNGEVAVYSIKKACNLISKGAGMGIYRSESARCQVDISNSAKYVNGAQFGLINGAEHIKGAQFGLMNGAEETQGTQIGIVNRTGARGGVIYGAQAGVLNAAVVMEGAQAGIVNMVHSVRMQVGAVNFAKWGKGAQAGIVNYVAYDISGMQAGAVNYARKAKGVQAGLVNIVQEADRVAQVGGVCFIRSNPWYAMILPVANYGGSKEKREANKRRKAEALRKEREELERDKLGVRI